MKEIINELATHLSANTYSIEYIEERLTNLCEIARLEGRKQQLDITPEIIGECITEPEQVSIKPEDMRQGEWYWYKKDYEEYSWVFKFKEIKDNKAVVFKSCSSDGDKYSFVSKQCYLDELHTIRPATRSEVLNYFPDEQFNDHTPINGC